MEGRFAGANLNPNEFGAILAIGIPFAWFLFLTQRGLYSLSRGGLPSACDDRHPAHCFAGRFSGGISRDVGRSADALASGRFDPGVWRW